MSLSYSGIIGNKGNKGSVTSVESWGTNNNILRDPPKSIMTRRIDKVNQDGGINEMYYHSGDRFAENISLYARGVNPMVSVEYGNNSNSTNTQSGNVTKGNSAKLPYRIMNAGAFRPPQLRQEQLLPLSRQPRLATQVVTNREFKDYSKSAVCDQQPKCYRQVKTETVEGYIAPTKSFKVQMPTKEHFVVKYIIDDPTYAEAFTNKNSRANLQIDNKEPLRQAMKEINQYSFSTKVRGGEAQNYIHKDMELERNMPFFDTETNKSSTYKTTLTAEHNLMLEKNIPEHNMISNRQRNIHTVIDTGNEFMLEKNLPEHNMISSKHRNIHTNIDADGELMLEKNMPNHTMVANKQRNIHTNIDADGEIILEKNMPNHTMASNLSDNRYVRIEPEHTRVSKDTTPYSTVISNSNSNIKRKLELNRDVNLPATLSVGGVSGSVGIPQQDRSVNYNSNYKTSKTEIAQRIMNSR